MGGGVFFCKKSGKGGVFCKKVELSSTQGALCTVSVFFIFTFYLFGGASAPNAPPPLPTGLVTGGNFVKCAERIDRRTEKKRTD